MIQEKTLQKQLLTIENRKILTLSGVTEVESSNENSVRLNTNMGRLIIYGSGLSIGKISVETGDFSMTGEINRIEYKTSGSSGKLSSLFR
ncbi:MAG: sporulation protein YabP [Clostridia bacterium]|nr:sporulation protein YabP [Clostridia bacterium]